MHTLTEFLMAFSGAIVGFRWSSMQWMECMED